MKLLPLQITIVTREALVLLRELFGRAGISSTLSIEEGHFYTDPGFRQIHVPLPWDAADQELCLDIYSKEKLRPSLASLVDKIRPASKIKCYPLKMPSGVPGTQENFAGISLRGLAQDNMARLDILFETLAVKENSMHPSTYEYLKPTETQLQQMTRVRAAAKAYNDVLDECLPEGPDKTFVIRNHRSNAMWANVAITRLPDGTPRE